MPHLAGVFAFVAVALLSWGLYGPLLHEGQLLMQQSSLRPLLCVGLSYFLVAVAVPAALLYWRGERGHWSAFGVAWSLTAGAAGAIGALGIIWAFMFRGSPVYVMPLVFGLAPVVNTLVTMVSARSFRRASGLFLAAIAVVALGAAGVLFFKPSPQNVSIHTADDGEITVTRTVVAGAKTETTTWTAASVEQLRDDPALSEAHRLYLRALGPQGWQIAAVFAAIALTALCWGSYGPMLHRGQAKMGGSRMRPFLCVGLAYFAIAVLVPGVLLVMHDEPGRWTAGGAFWSLAAGLAGAAGALGVLLAFHFGGRPIYVMPLVFGGAPVVNTLTTVTVEGSYAQLGAPFLVALLMVVAGAVAVLVLAPRADSEKTHG